MELIQCLRNQQKKFEPSPHFHKAVFSKYVVLTYDAAEEILWCDHSNETN